MVLDMGCGPDKIAGAVGVDHVPFPGVDVIWDLEKWPYPFEDGSVDHVYFRHSLEHLADAAGAVREAARILREGGRLTIICPHFSSLNAYSDLTHRRALGMQAFRLLCRSPRETAGSIYRQSLIQGDRGGGVVAFEWVEGRFVFPRLHGAVPFVPARWVGVSLVARWFPIFYECFLAFWCPAQEFSVTLRVVKAGGGATVARSTA